MLKRFIERPVLSTVISVLLVLVGLISLISLPITLFPDIAPPTVQVTATYPGASAEVVARSVATPIEEAVNGVENMTYMTSNSSNDGTMTLNVYFKQGTDPDIAAVNVQNRVSKVTSQVPVEVVQAGISTQKQQNSLIMFIALTSEDNSYDETFLQNYIKINLIPQVERIPGVAQALPFGGRDYSMRIWLKPDRLNAYGLSPDDITSAIQSQSQEAAPGRLGQSSDRVFEYVLKYRGKYNQVDDYENIVVKADSDGALIRLKDVARVELGSFTYSSNSLLDGHPTSGIAVYQTAGSNANDILTAIQQQVESFSETLPEGLSSKIFFNTKDFLDSSIHQVTKTLFEAFILVFIVVFIFLQDFRSTLIPAIAVPVAIIGTFFFMQLFGFSINLLTLFALVLAIGIVVDDAIVVVEAVHAKMASTDLLPRQATLESMHEISGAIISITLVMAAVFIPVGFMEGPAGVFYRQFAFTLAIAIVISAVNALTLSPALSALILKRHDNSPKKLNQSNAGETLSTVAATTQAAKPGFGKRFFTAFNAGFSLLTARYLGAVRLLIKRKWLAIGFLAAITATTWWMAERTPSGFIPTEDQGLLLYAVNTPPGSSVATTHKVLQEIEQIVDQQPFTQSNYIVEGLNFITNASAAPYGAGFIRLKHPEDRGPVRGFEEIAALMTQKVNSQVKGANAFFFNFPTIQGFGNVSGFEFMLQDRGYGSLGNLDTVAKAFVAELMKTDEIAYAFTTYSAGNPQYELQVDNDKALQMGVSVGELLSTLQVYYGSSFVNDFNRFGKYYRVITQADVSYRMDESSLDAIYVKSKNGTMIPANQLVEFKRVYGPETVTRNNLFNAVTINGVPTPGYSTGDAINAIEATAARFLPNNFHYEWTGMTREEINSGSQISLIFIMSLVFIYFLLSAQYESYILPLSILLTIPLGVFGVMSFINLFGIDNNIYVQVSLIMLIGLLAKNAILIVEYAVQRRKAGMSLVRSALAAARLRLRPILMTSFAFIAGLLPLMRATGASALGNRSIGTGAVGGMLSGVLLGIFIIPVLYVIFQYLHEKITKRRPGGSPKAAGATKVALENNGTVKMQ